MEAKQITMTMAEDFAAELAEAFDADIAAEGMQMLAEKVREAWMDRAELTLFRTYDKYMAGLNVEATGTGIRVTITGALPIWLEKGTPFDMKDYMLGRVIGSDDFNRPNADGKITKFRTVSANTRSGNNWNMPQKAGKDIHGQVMHELPRLEEEVFNVLLARIMP